jgi:flagellar biosynthesis regulator FlbT
MTDRQTGDAGGENAQSEEDDQAVQRNLRRIAHMFAGFRDDEIMRELCRLAVKGARERLISGG